jgi:branched-chain amino acid transport system permease protein
VNPPNSNFDHAWLIGRFMVILPFVVLAVLVPLAGAYWVKVFTSALAMTIAAAGVSVLYSRVGLVSLAGIALTGVGGWITLRLYHLTGLPFEVLMLASGLTTAVISMLIGLPALRIRGLYLAIVTLMAAAGFYVVVGSTGFPDGGGGFWGRVDGSSARVYMARAAFLADDTVYYLYTLLICILCMLLVHWHLKSKPGRAWALIRAGDVVAQSCGIRILYYQSWAFALSGFLAGIAGSLLATSVGILDSFGFEAEQSLLLFALVLIGGPQSWFGPLLAGILYRVVPALFEAWKIEGFIATAIFGAGLIHAIVTAPRGIAGQIEDGLAFLARKLKLGGDAAR